MKIRDSVLIFWATLHKLTTNVITRRTVCNKKNLSTILKVHKVKTILKCTVIMDYEVAIVATGCFCTEYEIVTAGSEFIWLGCFCRKKV